MVNTSHAYGYVRCSTEEQATVGVSIQSQVARLEAWATMHGTAITIEIDAGISGKNMNRPALQRALAAMRSGSILVVADLSRLSRSTRDALTIAETLAKRGAELVSLKEQIPAGPAGKLILTVLAALNELERDQISARTTAALAYKASRNEWCGGRPPMGYALDTDGKTLVENADEQAVIAEVRALRDAGMSLREVTAMLAERGRTSRVGRPFALTQIRRMIASAVTAA